MSLDELDLLLIYTEGSYRASNKIQIKIKDLVDLIPKVSGIGRVSLRPPNPKPVPKTSFNGLSRGAVTRLYLWTLVLCFSV